MTTKMKTKYSNGKPEKLRRSLQIDQKRTVDEAKRTIVMPVSSELAVERWFGMEILVHEPGAIDLSRMNDGAAVMADHDWQEQIGVVEKAWIAEDKRLWAELRFSKNKKADEVWTDIVDGIRRNVSIGYKVFKRELLEVENKSGQELDTYRITRWMPYEVSIVAVPADPNVGVGRSLNESGDANGDMDGGDEKDGGENRKEYEAEKNKKESELNMTPEEIAKMKEEARKEAELVIREQVKKETEQEHARTSEIRAIGEKCGMKDEAERAVSEKMSVDAFRKIALDAQVASRSIQASKIGMSEKEIRQFSFTRAILSQVRDSGVKADFEKECSDAFAKKTGKEARGIFVPPDVVLDGAERTFNQTTGAGSNLIATQLRPDMFIDILRNKSVLAQAGAFMMPGLVGNVAIPRQTGAMTAYWFNAESAGITAASNVTIDQVTMSPKTVGSYGDISRSLLKQSTPAAEQIVRNDIAAVVALAIDLAGLKGTASGGQPRGITLTSGINSGNWDTANTPTWAKLVAMETAVDLANALDGNFVYVMGAGLRGSCKTTVKATGQMGWLMDESGRVNSYPVLNSNQMAAGECIFGRFADLIVAMWGGLDLQVNPYIEALEKAGAIRVTALQDVDVAVRRPKSFTFYDNPSAT